MSAVALDTKQLIEDKGHEGGCKSDQGREYATPKGDQGDEEAGRAHDMAAQDYSRSSQIGRAGSFSKYRQLFHPVQSNMAPSDLHHRLPSRASTF